MLKFINLAYNFWDIFFRFFLNNWNLMIIIAYNSIGFTIKFGFFFFCTFSLLVLGVVFLPWFNSDFVKFIGFTFEMFLLGCLYAIAQYPLSLFLSLNLEKLLDKFEIFKSLLGIRLIWFNHYIDSFELFL